MAYSNFHTTLSPQMAEKAKRELNEKPQQIEAHLQSFRRWIDSMPHLNFPKDDLLMLAFLRHAKYVHAKAQARLDNFCTIRTSEKQGAPEWFKQPSLDDPKLAEYLKMGIMLPLGHTKDGISMVLMRAGYWDPNQFSMNEIRSFIYMDFDRIVFDPVTQVAGYGIIFDMEKISSKHMMRKNPKKEMKMEMKVAQECYPLRTKYLIYYKEPPILDALFKIFEFWMNEKMKRRMHRIRNEINKAYKIAPGLCEIMPKEYGGGAGTIDSLIVKNEKEFRDFYANPAILSTISVDESRRPDSAKHFLKEYKDFQGDMFGIQGTYLQIKEED